MTDRTCTRCGTPVVAGAHFCSRCGHDVSGEQSVLATAKMAAPAPPKPPPAAPPESEILEPLRRATVGDYDVAGELGRGGMATVFLAHDIALDRKVAIKVMTPSLVTGAGMVERFKREARTAASLSHPHIIPIYAVRETERLLFFVMKFVEGRSLDTVIRKQGPLPIPMVQAIMSQVGGALGYAHRRGIVHRDMKPANIMLDDEGWAVVTDFGIAKVADARGLTMTGVTIGTPSYMSPEQCASKEVSGATDQYSLGIVAYELLTGKVPFDADSLMGIMWKHFNEPPPPVRQGRPDCPESMALAIERMLAKDPTARWPTMEEAVAAIGTPPMAPGDPIRKQMRALAHGGLGETLRDQVHTPASPIPTGPGTSPDAPTMPSSAAPIPSGFQAPPPPTTRAPTSADTPTMLTDDAATVVTSEADTVLAAGPASVSHTAAPAGPTTPPPTPRPATAPVEPVKPSRKRALALGLVGLTVVSAAAVWAVVGLRSPATSPDDALLAGDSVPAGLPPAAPVARLQLNHKSQSMAVGASGELLAFLVDSANTPLGNRTITWTSTDPTVATARAGLGVSGVVEALRAGTARIIAASEGKADTATVTVTAVRAAVATVAIELQSRELAPGDTVNVGFTIRDASGANLGGRTPEVQSSDPAVLRVAGTRLIALKAGTANIVAVAERVRSEPTSVTVAVPPIQSVTVGGLRTGLEPEQSAKLGLTVLDARNRVVTEYRASWQSSNTRVATVQDDGTVRAVAEGEATITATVADKRGQFTLRVRPPARIAVARLQISRPVNTLQAGQTASVSASPLDAGNRTLMDRRVDWESSNPAVATVSPDGTVAAKIEAKSAGTTTITATSETQTARFSLEVTDPPAAVVDPPAGPESPTSPGVSVASVGLGAEFTCATLSNGSARCWGAERPAATVDAGGLQAVVAGVSHACGLTADGSALCWGNNRYGQLGTGEAANQNVARPVRVATDLRFRTLAAGGSHTCGVAADGSAWCWGRGNDGQLGNNGSKDQAVPVAVVRGLSFSELAAGEKYTCGITTEGKGYCWGDGYADQLGIGIQEQRRQPEDLRVREALTAIAAGKESACAIGAEGTYCWGRGGNPFGSTPRRVATDARFTQITVGAEFACGLTRAGTAWCWGKNDRGQLGDGSGRDQRQPVQVATSESLTALRAGNGHACAVTGDGGVLCWGENGKGQVGTGGTEPVTIPGPVDVRRQ